MKVTLSNIPWLLSLTVIVVVVFILGLGNYAYKNTEKSTFDQFNRRQLIAARRLCDGIKGSFKHLSGELDTLGKMLKMRDLDESLRNRLLQNLLDELEPWGVNNIQLLDQNGMVEFNMAAPQLVGTDFSREAYFKKAREMVHDPGSNGRFITQLVDFTGIESGQKGFLVAMPLVERESFHGVILCTQRLNFWIGQYILGVKIAERGHVFMLDDQFTVLWSPDLSLSGNNLLDEGKGFPRFQKVVKDFISGNSGTGEYTFRAFDELDGRFSDDEEEILVAYEPVNLADKLLAVAVWAPKASARRLIHSVYIRQLMVMGFTIMVILAAYVFAVILSFRMSKRLKREVEIKTRELEESHQRLLTILDSLNAAVYAADMDTHEILFANKYLRDIYGDIEGKICWEVFRESQPGPCEFCTNKELRELRQLRELQAEARDNDEIKMREFESTLSGLWHEHREQAVRWVDGRVVRLEIAMDKPCR